MQEEVKDEALKDPNFEGNYIDNFKNNADEEEFYPGHIISWIKSEDKIIIYAENSILELIVYSPTIIRFRFANEGYFEDDFSYAIDPDFTPPYPTFLFEEDEENIYIKTEKLICRIQKKDFNICMSDVEGNIIAQDEKGYHWKEYKRFGGHVVISTMRNDPDTQFYGLGDKTGPLNLKGTRKQIYGMDCYGYGNDTDPVYKNIPFFMGLKDQRGYGIFMDNSFRSFFDFGYERTDALSFWAQGGEMRYYFIYGPELMDVVKQYAQLTGRPQMPPKWSLGYHQSKWSYYPEATVRKLADTFREKKIPCDVIHLDIDYMDGFRVFTWDQKRFPDPKKMMADLRTQGFKTIVIVDPGIKIDPYYSVFQQGVHHDYFCKRMDGARFKGSVWPGSCHFPDFTKAAARKWWGGLFEGYIKDGVAGVWNDMNEPAVFEEGTFPRDVRHNFDGHYCSHRKGHNVYGMQMARATHEGQQRFLGNTRAFTITRSAYAGIQRYSSAWTGDNVATWEHLQIANVQCQRLAASGLSFVGSDVGGFIGTPSAELYTRWIQLAVFHPFFRTHSSGDHGDKEPWVFEDPYFSIIRRFIEFRYELLPYLYTTFWQHAELGTPMLRSLHLVAQDDQHTYLREEEFLLGDHLLVCPVTEEAAEARMVYLPKGDWYHYWTDELLQGAKEIEVETPMDQIPLFMKAGAVLPMQPKMQYVDEFTFESLSLHFYFPTEEHISYLYEDDGVTLDYQHGEKKVRKFTAGWKHEHVVLVQEIKGKFTSSYENYELIIHGCKHDQVWVSIDEESEIRVEKIDGLMKIKVPKSFGKISFRIQ